MRNRKNDKSPADKKRLSKIGPVPVIPPEGARERQRIEDVEKPFKVDRDDPRMQQLAKEIGWERLYQIEQSEREGFERAKELD